MKFLIQVELLAWLLLFLAHSFHSMHDCLPPEGGIYYLLILCGWVVPHPPRKFTPVSQFLQCHQMILPQKKITVTRTNNLEAYYYHQTMKQTVNNILARHQSFEKLKLERDWGSDQNKYMSTQKNVSFHTHRTVLQAMPANTISLHPRPRSSHIHSHTTMDQHLHYDDICWCYIYISACV